MTRYAYGRLDRTDDSRDHAFRAPAPYSGSFVDLTSGFPVAPRDQGQLGSCVSHGVGGAVEYARAKDGLPLVDPARLFVYWWGRHDGGYPIDQDTGLEVRDGLQAVHAHGAPPETDYPYMIDRFAETPSSTADADGGRDVAVVYGAVDPGGVDDAIASGYPVVHGFDVYPGFESDQTAETGIVPMPDAGEQSIGGHCTVIVSTPVDGAKIGGRPGVPYRKHRNSWGVGWGVGGYYWAPVAYTTKYGSDYWVLTHMSDPNPPVPPTPPGPSDLDAALAAQLHQFVQHRHTTPVNRATAKAARVWLTGKGL